MICKFFEVGKYKKKINFYLFYGENEGQKIDVIQSNFNEFTKENTFKYNEKEVTENKQLLFESIYSKSFFESEKLILISEVTDKIFDLIEQIISDNVSDVKIILIAKRLDKKSKIRNFFEKEKNYACVPCYPDNEISIKKIIQEKLSGFDGVSPFILNLIYENTNLDRIKLYNELEKILVCFTNKKIDKESLEVLLNSSTNDNFNLLKDEAIIGNKINTNKYLADTMIEAEKGTYYLNIINQRLINLYQLIKKANTTTLELAVNEAKPPIFWKDKPIYIKQLQKWNSKKLKKILNDTYELEIRLKSNSIINKNLLIKKLILDICVAANS